jgi:hypothetical protein
VANPVPASLSDQAVANGDFQSKIQIVGKLRLINKAVVPALITLLISICALHLAKAKDVQASPITIETLRKEIMILHEAKGHVERHKGGDARDSARYIEYLDRRIGELCSQAITMAGVAAVSGLPCPAPALMIPGYEIPKSQGQDDRLRAAETELLESLGNFDEMLAAEQQRLKTSRQKAAGCGPGEAATGAASGAVSGAGTGTGSGAGDEEGYAPQPGASGTGQERGEGSRVEAAGSKAEGTQGAGAEGTGSGEKGRGHQASESAGMAGSSGQKGAPATRGDSTIHEDDDIVARQLKEAAERETDPELKKRLWEEYRKYKEANR